jgi:hypothetical protein
MNTGPENSPSEDAEEETFEKALGADPALDLFSKPIEHQPIENQMPGEPLVGGVEETVGQEGMDISLADAEEVESKGHLHEIGSDPVPHDVLEKKYSRQGNQDAL